jgi:hypothetical protein
MAKKKSFGQPRKLFKTEIQVYELLLKKIDLGRTLTEIEFSVCNQELKSLYCNKKASKGEIDSFLVQFCDIDTIHDCIISATAKNRIVAKEVFERVTDEKLLKEYLLMKIENNFDLKDYECKKLDNGILLNYFKTQIDDEENDNLWLSFENFNSLDEEYRIKYILNRGLFQVSPEIKEWFYTWKKVKARDLRIQQILAD